MLLRCLGIIRVRSERLKVSPQAAKTSPQAQNVTSIAKICSDSFADVDFPPEIHVSKVQNRSKMKSTRNKLYFAKKMKGIGSGSSSGDVFENNKRNRVFRLLKAAWGGWGRLGRLGRESPDKSRNFKSP